MKKDILYITKSEIRRRLFEENYRRIKRCLDMLSLDQIWHRPNQQSNSVGNLILHVEGNVRQWILNGLFKQKDVRNRNWEFENTTQFSKDMLMDRLTRLQRDLDSALEDLSLDQLIDTHRVQCYHETGLSIIIHVLEHFSYHTGQISYYTKYILNKDLEYYADDDLNQTQ